MEKSCLHWFLTGVAVQCLLVYSTASATTTCTAVDEVQSFDQCWKTFNLGATQVAIADNDEAAYGDLYQWGRPADGHQKRGTPTDSITPPISDLSSTDVPGHSAFIKNSSGLYDWRTTQNNYLWQGLGGINNPCPQGFRLPTEQEFQALFSNESITNIATAYSSPLKFVATGIRNSNGEYSSVGTHGAYWSSTVDDTYAYSLVFDSSNVLRYSSYRVNGMSIRCLKD